MPQQPQTSPIVIRSEEEEYTSDSDEDPNEAAFRPRREASIRARVVIASACDIRHVDRPTAMPSRRVELEVENEPDRVSVETFKEPLNNRVRNFPTSHTPEAVRTQKRRREVFDCVFMSSSNAFKRPKKETDTITREDLKKKMKLWENPKVKKKKNNPVLLPETIRSRIRHIGFDVPERHFKIDKLMREVMDKLKEHGMNDFMFMNTEFQPQAPEVPGAPGLWFNPNDNGHIGRHRVFTKINMANPNNKWLYVGQYDVRLANPSRLSVQEWRAQPVALQNTWADAIANKDWGDWVCARILARKLYGREPYDDECQELVDSGRYREVTTDEVKEGYHSGKELMVVWTMKCVGYDNRFQKDISQTYHPGWIPPPPKTKEEKEAEAHQKREERKLSKEQERQRKAEEQRRKKEVQLRRRRNMLPRKAPGPSKTKKKKPLQTRRTMQRRMGFEGMMGIGGGGIVSKESQRYLDLAEDLLRKKKPKKAVPYLQKALETGGGNNLDAVIKVSTLFDAADGIEVLKDARERGRAMLKKSLGTDCFDDDSEYVGNFWGILETRPYMRVLQALAERLYMSKHFNESADVMCEMLRLCPGDNIGTRSLLGSVLCLAGRYADAVFFAEQWLTPECMQTGESPERGGTAFAPPTKGTHLITRDPNEEAWAWGPLPHTGALAAFKLWGDCSDSRAYLEFAVKCTPHILLKVLGRVKKPETLNMMPRSQNGPEEAHDYLWLAQDMWMEPDVWAWANNNPVVKAAVLKDCSRKDCVARETRVAEFKRCGACHTVSYCSADCQKLDWPHHKTPCKEHKALKDQIKRMTMGRG
ncbi:hypothetical protein D9619_009278 [Psilocybe cf. subviscida]|uniref:MYND-type domain-containing protein n=1 Tax=Psilocybe cf. subviscida TaxID=2480587 RepID=A0A8H5FA30_9AGAR|nr:hypothetical protein D9619_009278 [Psilocybe cf. subviscida]